MGGLLRLADIAESLPAPEHPVECRRWERYARENPGKAVGLFFAAFLLLALLFCGLLVLLVVLRLHWLIPLGFVGGWLALRSHLKKQKAAQPPPAVPSPSSFPPTPTPKTPPSPPPLPPASPE